MTGLSFLFATWEGGGTIGPVLTVARKMIARGHRVRVMSDACNRAEAEAAGAAFVPWTRAPSRPDRSRASCLIRDWEVDPRAGFERTLDAIMTGPALAYAEDLIQEIGRERADLVVSNELLFGVMAGCEAAGQRLALLTCNLSLFPLPGVPPMGPGLPPARTAEDRALHAEVAAGTAAVIDARLPGLNAARQALGLPALSSLGGQATAADAILLGTARAFDFAPETLPPGIRYVGPQLGEPAWAEPWISPWRADDARPLVLAGFSTTFQGHAAVLQRVIDAAADLPVRLLVTLGTSLDASELRPADNTVLAASAAHDAVLREAVLVVTHGGHGTVARALVHGRPMLILPHGRDQADNAVRVTERGAGLALGADAGTETIRAALVRLLWEPALTAAARALGARVADEVRGSPVVAELEALAASREGRYAA